MLFYVDHKDAWMLMFSYFLSVFHSATHNCEFTCKYVYEMITLASILKRGIWKLGFVCLGGIVWKKKMIVYKINQSFFVDSLDWV